MTIIKIQFNFLYLQFIVSEIPTKSEKEDNQKNMLPGGYECNDDYTYIRGRGKYFPKTRLIFKNSLNSHCLINNSISWY